MIKKNFIGKSGVEWWDQNAADEHKNFVRLSHQKPMTSGMTLRLVIDCDTLCHIGRIVSAFHKARPFAIYG